ncbi:MAG: lysophospholipid acyltransferase family protein [Verrucomicrobiota bacterium]
MSVHSQPRVPKQASGIVVPQPISWRRRLAASAVYGVAKLFMASWRCQATHVEIPNYNGPMIFCVWHNRLALSMVAYSHFGKAIWPSAGLAAMISASKDGGLLASVLKKFGVQAVRGSSSRRGRQALLESTTWMEKGFHIAITPDGPRGPRYRVQDGVLALAQVTGAPIVPVSARIRGKIRLRSWDRFQIPLPFARCDIHFGAPIHIPRELSNHEKEKFRKQLQKALMEFTVD